MKVIELIRVLAKCEPNAELSLGFKDTKTGYYNIMQYEAIYHSDPKKVAILFRDKEEDDEC